ncbi:FlhC family transcriptional regulator [Enterobacter chuandaensis]|uniref:FlhC family transcriptional regulator n=1 Tax=Enterobacter chuandaensis TaxID=2497875 RepID=UPI00300C41E6
MNKVNILSRISEMHHAIELILLGANVHMIEMETNLSRKCIRELYKATLKRSPPRGRIPVSIDWYIRWENNINSSMFYNVFDFFKNKPSSIFIEVLLKAYRLYLEQSSLISSNKVVLGISRAWALLKHIESGALTTTFCLKCKGNFITLPYDKQPYFVCNYCSPPSRARKKIDTSNNHKSEYFIRDYTY